MSESTHTQPKALAPRKLEQTETLQTLNHWRSVLKNYYRRCQFYGYFLAPGITWNNNANRGFTVNEPSGLKRTPAQLASDLEGFLSCIGNYLPFDYVSDKLINETTNMDSVWSVIYEIYDAELDASHFLDYASMTRETGETYRNFYNRLVGFTRQHLPKNRVTAEGIVSPVTGESLTVALLDSIAVHWLLSIDRRLISIIKVEFATELKTRRLCELIKPIATNIDELLARYDKGDQVVSVHANNSAALATPALNNQDLAVDMIIRRLEKLENNSNKPFNNRFKQRKTSQRKRVLCKHCLYINTQLGSSLDVNHSSDSCGKRKLSVNVIEALATDTLSDSDSEQFTDTPGPNFNHVDVSNISSLQSKCQQVERVNNTGTSPSRQQQQISCHCLDFGKTLSNQAVISDPQQQNVDSCNQIVVSSPLPSVQSSTYNFLPGSNQDLEIYNTDLHFSAKLRKISSSSYSWNSIHKAKSPRIKCRVNNTIFAALVDSGAELNVLDKNFADLVKIGITDTKEVAHAANKLPLDVCGQTTAPVTIWCCSDSGDRMLHLGIMLVVANLGVDCLIGEPGKTLNNIVCLPKQQIVVLAIENDVCQVPYYSANQRYVLARATRSIMLQPGDEIEVDLPTDLQHLSHVHVTPRPQTIAWNYYGTC